jgi:hypothetical protein
MSNTSRRRATTSRRRATLAAGVFLAGAAIPIAAAGTAWADETGSQNQTETVGQLERQGLSASQAEAVVKAEKHDTPVQVSYDGTTVVDANQGGKPGSDATATTSVGSTKDVAAAIGDASSATATGGTKDLAFANGTNSDAFINDASDSKATATGTGASAAVENNSGIGTVSNDVATANGANSNAAVESGAGLSFGSGNVTHDVATASGGGSATVEITFGSGAVTNDTAHASNDGIGLIQNNGAGAVSHDIVSASGVSASGTNPGGFPNSDAQIANSGTEPVSNDTATATKGGYADVTNFGDSTVPVTRDAAIGNNGAAGVVDAGSSRATAINTGPATFTGVNGGDDNAVTAGASVSYATGSTARAEGAGSMAAVSGNPTITDGYITDSHATDTNGTSAIVITSDTTETRGTVALDPGVHSAVTPDVVSGPSGGETVLLPVHAETTPLTDVHEMPPTPLP